MSFKETVYTALMNDVTVDALVDGRVYPQVAPEGVEAPMIVYRELAVGGSRTLSGVLFDDSADYDIWLSANTPEQLLELTSAVTAVAWPDGVVTQPVPGSDGYDFEHDRYTKIIELLVSQ